MHNQRRVLNVAEKPSIAKEISRILAGGQAAITVREGTSKYNKNFDFGYLLDGAPCRFTMTSVLGHLTDIDFTETHRRWHSCEPAALFTAPLHTFVVPNSKQVATNIEREVRGCNDLIIWTDCDREGENIGFEVLGICRSINPRINVRRAHFSSLIPAEIHNAMRTLTPPDQRLSDAVEARKELDLRVGAAFTRFQSFLLQPRFNVLAKQTISYGPCQFPTLGFIVDRYLRIEHFVAEDFWHIDVTAKKTPFAWRRGRLFDEDISRMLHEKVSDSAQATVVKVTNKEVSKWRPLPLTTVELQKMGSTKLRMSSDRTMKVAEELYNKGYISYPRTETDSFDDAFDHQTLVQTQQPHPIWGQYAQNLLQGGINRPRKGKNSDQAHPPIHPAKLANPNDLTHDEQAIYELVVRRYLACLSKDAKGHETVVELEIAEEFFSATGLVVLERNYLEIYKYENWSTSEMPEFTEGEKVKPSLVKLVGGHTSPPNMLTEADLIGLMDKNGIGTDATIHEHIKKIIEREYAIKQQNYFYPSSLGVGLVEGYNAMGYPLSKPHLRALMEADMKCVALGTKTRANVLTDAVRQYRDVFTGVSGQSDVLVASVRKYIDGDDDAAPPAGAAPAQAPPPPPPPRGGRGDGGGDNGDDDHYRGNGPPPAPAPRAVAPYQEVKPKPRVVDLEADFVEDDLDLAEFDLPDAFGDMPVVPQRPPQQTAHRARDAGPPAARVPSIDMPPWRPPRDDPPPAWSSARVDTPPPPPPLQSNWPSDAPFMSNQADSSQQRHCQCGTPAVLRTAMKEGKNKGRKFFCCSKGKDQQQCNFFEWEDEPPRAAPSGAGFQSNVGSSSFPAAFGASDPSRTIMCNCNMPATQRTVAKDGPNKGRSFYGCSKPRDQGCQFFLWGDGQDPPRPPSGGSGSGGSGADTATCYKCNQVGHFASNCPGGGGGSGGFGGNGGGGGGGYGRSGGGGSAADSATCYKCNQVGHFASNCPSSGSGGGGGGGYGRGGGGGGGGGAGASGGSCYKCNQPGHFASNCPNGGAGGGGGGGGGGASSGVCYKCNKPGHFANACDSSGGGGGGGSSYGKGAGRGSRGGRGGGGSGYAGKKRGGGGGRGRGSRSSKSEWD